LKKEGGKNRKIGRHGRNPSSINQAKRTERNKAHRIKIANPKGIGHIPPKYSRFALVGRSTSGKYLWMTLCFRGKRTRVYCSDAGGRE
jgi:hypothetical protein